VIPTTLIIRHALGVQLDDDYDARSASEFERRF